MDVSSVVGALGATGAIIVLGRLLRDRFGPEFWRGTEWVAYHLLLPALLVKELAEAEVTGALVRDMAAVLAGSALAGAAIVLAARPLLGRDGPAFTSTFQSTVRFNTYIGFFVAQVMFGSEGLVYAAIASAVLVPIANVTSTLVLLRHGEGDGSASTVRSLGTNPLILACLVGFLANVTSTWLVPDAVRPALGPAVAGIDLLLGLLADAALPMGLLCVGAGLVRGRAHAGRRRYAAAADVMRFAVVPALAAGACLLVGLSGAPATVAVLFQSLPTASSAYVLARALGGDAALMAAVIARQTVLACVTLPVWMALASLI